MSTSTSNVIRTRFAPSPTGYLHLGGARTALFSWAFARHHQGTFVLRIEDTDLERSTPEAVQGILDGMQWLGLDADEGPFYQMQRMDRYKAMIDKLLEKGDAYLCYCTQDELNQMREKQRENGQRIRYDGTWRPEAGKVLPTPPADVKPVVRFKNPLSGAVTWDDLVKGPISINNEEMDDLIIARQDGTPTYNFCVVVDDLERHVDGFGRAVHERVGDDLDRGQLHIGDEHRTIDAEVRQRILTGDEPINTLHIEIDDLCLKLLALHQELEPLDYWHRVERAVGAAGQDIALLAVQKTVVGDHLGVEAAAQVRGQREELAVGEGIAEPVRDALVGFGVPPSAIRWRSGGLESPGGGADSPASARRQARCIISCATHALAGIHAP